MKQHVVEHIKPGTEPVEYRPEHRMVVAPGDHHRQGRAESDPGLDHFITCPAHQRLPD